MSDSNHSDVEPPFNPYAVENEFENASPNEIQNQAAPNRLAQGFGWVCLIVLTPVLGFAAFFLTCVGMVLSTDGMQEGVLVLSGAAGVSTMIVSLYFGGRWLISIFKTKDQ